MAVGIAAAGLTVVCAGVATAVVPFSPGTPTPTPVAHSGDTDWSATPKGYTQAQYDAFWSAGYTNANLATLNDLWKSGSFDTQARAGKMILDGRTPPVAPRGKGSAPCWCSATTRASPTRRSPVSRTPPRQPSGPMPPTALATLRDTDLWIPPEKR